MPNYLGTGERNDQQAHPNDVTDLAKGMCCDRPRPSTQNGLSQLPYEREASSSTMVMHMEL